MKKIFTLITFIGALFCAGCQEGAQSGSSGKAQGQLEHNIEWKLVSGEDSGKTFGAADNITLVFVEDEGNTLIGGESGVNLYNAPVTIDAKKGSISLGLGEMLATTRMMGPPELMQKENDYLNALRRINRYELNDNELILIGDGVTLKYSH